MEDSADVPMKPIDRIRVSRASHSRAIVSKEPIRLSQPFRWSACTNWLAFVACGRLVCVSARWLKSQGQFPWPFSHEYLFAHLFSSKSNKKNYFSFAVRLWRRFALSRSLGATVVCPSIHPSVCVCALIERRKTIRSLISNDSPISFHFFASQLVSAHNSLTSIYFLRNFRVFTIPSTQMNCHFANTSAIEWLIDISHFSPPRTRWKSDLFSLFRTGKPQERVNGMNIEHGNENER